MHVIPGYPSLSDEARGVLKFLWRKSHVKDNWAKGGEISDAWDRWSIFPWYMYPRYDLEWSTRVAAKIAQEIPAWREGCAEIIDRRASERHPRLREPCGDVDERAGAFLPGRHRRIARGVLERREIAPA